MTAGAELAKKSGTFFTTGSAFFKRVKNMNISSF
jgi:hypothetical protein